MNEGENEGTAKPAPLTKADRKRIAEGQRALRLERQGASGLEPQKKKHMVWTLIKALVGIALMVSGGLGLASHFLGGSQTVAIHKLRILFVDHSDDTNGIGICANDTYQGQPVTITSQTGQVIGTATLGSGVLVDKRPDPYNSAFLMGAACGYPFTVPVATGTTFYGVKVGNLPVVEISASTVRAAHWSATVNVGRPCYTLGVQGAC